MPRMETDAPVNLARQALADQIQRRLADHSDELKRQWSGSGPINHFVLDDVLPEEWAQAIRCKFPNRDAMTLKSSLRERKHVAAQMSNYEPLLEECIYAFQAPDVVQAVEHITGLEALEPDALLYAGGISVMARGDFLNPHVDNSHDKFRQRYRVLNLLYYVSPDWPENAGGNLELWPQGPKGRPLTLVSKFNRLVVMVTRRESWHSVSKNLTDHDRCCVSNYYFSERPVGRKHYFHVTSFRGRPEQPLRDWVLRADIGVRMMIRRFFPKGIKDNPHYYRKDASK
jgi:Rps23 Pro-64 3,4-dihydroxylase Tpa1-like proline 4-hydroxylase